MSTSVAREVRALGPAVGDDVGATVDDGDRTTLGLAVWLAAGTGLDGVATEPHAVSNTIESAAARNAREARTTF